MKTLTDKEIRELRRRMETLNDERIRMVREHALPKLINTVTAEYMLVRKMLGPYVWN